MENTYMLSFLLNEYDPPQINKYGLYLSIKNAKKFYYVTT